MPRNTTEIEYDEFDVRIRFKDVRSKESLMIDLELMLESLHEEGEIIVESDD
jgi:hypothetical protein